MESVTIPTNEANDLATAYLGRVRTRVGSYVEAELITRQSRLSDIDPTMAEQLLKGLTESCTGGKMLRAALVDLGYRIAGGDEGEPRLLPIQGAIELTHLGLIIHDDIIDRSQTRRKKPTLNTYFATVHEREGYKGDSHDYGNSIAMLAGDVAICLAFELALQSTFSEIDKTSGISDFVANLISTGLGQAMDVNLTARLDVSDRDIQKMTRYKTAFYTVVAPMQLGARLRGPNPHLRGAIEGFGIPLGEAYQMRDDLLGVFGQEDEIGKPVLSDLKEGKQTLLLNYGLHKAEGAELQHLQKCMGNPATTMEDLDRVRQTLERCGARQRVEDMMNQKKEMAKKSILALTSAIPKSDELRALIRDLCDRIVRPND